jgi:hypothetical protein
MQWRHLGLVRAWSAAGLLSCSLLGAASPVRADDPDSPAPRADLVTETVSVLDARKSGDLALDVRGSGEDRVKMTLQNKSTKRLHVVLPPGLVASSAAGQRGGGGFQSMGLGSVSNRLGTFGEFRTTSDSRQTGFRSVGTSEKGEPAGVTLSPGKSIALTLPSVCLNYGVRTPAGRDKFDVVNIDDYSNDPRVRRALRSLATFGTSQGVAQAVMWNVCNGVSFGVMAGRSSKTMNGREIALASRFVEALDRADSSALVDPASLTDGRLYVRIVGEGTASKEAARLATEVAGLRVLGLPVRVLGTESTDELMAPAMLINVVLSAGQSGETRGQVGLSELDGSGRWVGFGKTAFVENAATNVLDGPGLARVVDRAVSSAFVGVKTTAKSSSATNLKLDNRLPFTIASVEVRAGTSSGAPVVPFHALGIAPGRSATVAIESPSGKVEHVELNGL